MEFIEIYPKVRIYRGLLTGDGYEKINAFRESNEWNSWYVFGELTGMQVQNFKFKEFPSPEEWEGVKNSSLEPKQANLEILDAFYAATSDYVKTYDFKLDNWNFNTPSICMYETNGGSDENIGLFIHTDVQQERIDAPGEKPGITCTMYLNGDYEGGGITFKIEQEDGSYHTVYHKPLAGDILVFPSNKPYYHGVDKTTKGQKYFVRSFWQYTFPGTEEWLANQEKYGPSKWAEMEEERIKFEMRAGKFGFKESQY